MICPLKEKGEDDSENRECWSRAVHGGGNEPGVRNVEWLDNSSRQPQGCVRGVQRLDSMYIASRILLALGVCKLRSVELVDRISVGGLEIDLEDGC